MSTPDCLSPVLLTNATDDGRCVIDVVQSQYGSSDLASLLDIGNAAEQVMMKCIDPISAPATGGYVSNVGMQISKSCC